MKHYSISLTISDPENNKQLISVQAPSLPGADIYDIATKAMGSVMIEPEPEILVTPKPSKRKLFGSKRAKEVEIEPPKGFDPAKDVE